MPAAGPLRVRGLSLAYRTPSGDAHPVLDLDALDVEPGSSVGITGPSGAGKTTLLYAVTGIERPDTGSVRWGDTEIGALAESQRDAWRLEHVGFVFQDISLIQGLNVLDNVLLTLRFDHWRAPPAMRQRACELLAQMRAPAPESAVETLSRGEQQRVAIARAMLRQPAVIVADEPTASLDSDAGLLVLELLTAACSEHGVTMLMVTHDSAALALLDTVYRLESGRLSAAQ